MFSVGLGYEICVVLLVTALFSSRYCCEGVSLNIREIAHYLDYIPYRQEGFASLDDFRTLPAPPTDLRNRKMEIGQIKLQVEDVLLNAVWPGRWPYGFEDFRPLDYQLDDVFNTQAQYIYSQSLLKSDYATLLPGLLRVPISRHFVYPKDKLAMIDHLSQFITQNNVSVLEIFSTYESILPANIRYDAVVGVGWDKREMKANALLDDFIAQDVSTDPFLPLADNYFDFVVMPANFQLLQKPRELMQEVNRVLKPGGTAFVGVKLALWSFLGWKQGRYYMETNYLEDILAAGSFFHYAEGFTKPQAFDLTLPELNIVGQIKDVLFPQPRLDFYAVVQARKRKDSPHGKDTVFVTDPEVIARGNEVRGEQFQPRVLPGGSGLEERFGPYY